MLLLLILRFVLEACLPHISLFLLLALLSSQLLHFGEEGLFVGGQVFSLLHLFYVIYSIEVLLIFRH